jgi:hypothetical protein
VPVSCEYGDEPSGSGATVYNTYIETVQTSEIGATVSSFNT